MHILRQLVLGEVAVRRGDRGREVAPRGVHFDHACERVEVAMLPGAPLGVEPHLVLGAAWERKAGEEWAVIQVDRLPQSFRPDPWIRRRDQSGEGDDIAPGLLPIERNTLVAGPQHAWL